jgi:light-regulated signal transduction histidine kinase (bacteriophytochrome)
LQAANEELRRSNAALTVERARVETANDALRRANSDLEQFAYSASHDLQEPIRNVAIYTQVLERHYGNAFDDRARQYLAFIRDGAQRMELLVRGLLAYTEAASGDPEPAGIIDANVAFDRAVANLSEAIRQAGASVVSTGLPEVRMHEVHLQQLFQNLIGNAVKYRSEEPPCIRVAADAVEGYWRFSVRDNGIGIDPEYKEKIFGIFKRLHSNGKYAGAGIGLAICQRVVERYGGRIWVESKAGEGSTFLFTIRNE